MKQLIGFILLNKCEIDIFKNNKIWHCINIFRKEDFLNNIIKLHRNKDKYYVSRVYSCKNTVMKDNIIILPSNAIVNNITLSVCRIGTPRYIGKLEVWKDMYNHGVLMQSNNTELTEWLLNNIRNKLSVEPRFKYNPVLEMLSKLEYADNVSSDESIEDAFNECMHIEDFSKKYSNMVK